MSQEAQSQEEATYVQEPIDGVVLRELEKNNMIPDIILDRTKALADANDIPITNTYEYDKVDAARKLIKTDRVSSEKVLSHVTKQYHQAHKEAVRLSKEFVRSISDSEDRLIARTKAWDDEQEAIRKRRQEELDAKLKGRADHLLAIGFELMPGTTPQDDLFVLEGMRIPRAQTASADDVWANLVRSAEMAASDRNDRLKAEEEERLAKEAEEKKRNDELEAMRRERSANRNAALQAVVHRGDEWRNAIAVIDTADSDTWTAKMTIIVQKDKEQADRIAAQKAEEEAEAADKAAKEAEEAAREGEYQLLREVRSQELVNAGAVIIHGGEYVGIGEAGFFIRTLHTISREEFSEAIIKVKHEAERVARRQAKEAEEARINTMTAQERLQQVQRIPGMDAEQVSKFVAKHGALHEIDNWPELLSKTEAYVQKLQEQKQMAMSDRERVSEWVRAIKKSQPVLHGGHDDIVPADIVTTISEAIARAEKLLPTA